MKSATDKDMKDVAIEVVANAIPAKKATKSKKDKEIEKTVVLPKTKETKAKDAKAKETKSKETKTKDTKTKVTKSKETETKVKQQASNKTEETIVKEKASPLVSTGEKKTAGKTKKNVSKAKK